MTRGRLTFMVVLLAVCRWPGSRSSSRRAEPVEVLLLVGLPPR
jgi:hypothetical protein